MHAVTCPRWRRQPGKWLYTGPKTRGEIDFPFFFGVTPSRGTPPELDLLDEVLKEDLRVTLFE